MPAVCLKIDEDQRPVKLRKIVLGFPCSDNQTEFKFDLTLNYKIASVIQTYSEQKPALVVQHLFLITFIIFLPKSVDSEKTIFLLTVLCHKKRSTAGRFCSFKRCQISIKCRTETKVFLY